MKYRARDGQVSAGEAIGILLLDTVVPFIPGDVANATTYAYPVRFQKVRGFTVRRALDTDPSIYDALFSAARDLVGQGVRAVTGDCGFMGIHQKKLAKVLDVPVFLSSLIQAPFISAIIGPDKNIGVITADRKSVTGDLWEAVGVHDTRRIVIRGLEDQPRFYDFAIGESGTLDSVAVENEIVSTARKMVTDNPGIGAVLLECSLLPPYAAAVHEAIKRPVFDYITMIDYVFSAVVKRPFKGFI